MMIRKLTDWFLDLLFPTRCVLCRRSLPPGRPMICADCHARLPVTDGLRVKGNYFSECVPALYYEGAVRDAILRYKFGGAQAYAPAFGELIAERVYEDLEGKYDILSWAPLARDRLRRRGYDQSRLLAENVAKRLRCPLTSVLTKKNGVHPQSRTRDKDERRTNIAGAYSVVDPALVAGARVLLIDDIITTGSTLSECAKTLLMAGAEDVVCATLAAAR